jgi:hypothetical protein
MSRKRDSGWILLSAAFVWLFVAVIIGRIIVAIFSPVNPAIPPMWLPFGTLGAHITFGLGSTFSTEGGNIPIGIALQWWNIPGTISGAIIAIAIVCKCMPRK